MTPPALELTRAQILAHRRQAQALDARLPARDASRRHAAWAGLQDSMPRAALLSLHARVDGITHRALENAMLVQLWGPRYSAYVVHARDAPVFTLGRLPEAGATRRTAEDLATRLSAALGERRLAHGEAARALREPPNRLRYATLTGRVRMHWDGARQPTIWIVPPSSMSHADARHELARRYLRVFGPGTAEAFAAWAGVPPREAQRTFEQLRAALVPVRTPLGRAWILADDERTFREPGGAPAPVRLLPSGDTYFLFQRAAERALLVEDAMHRAQLWTSRVWPGALMVHGAVVGVWRRSEATVTIETWRRLVAAERVAVEEEVARLPIPGVSGAVAARWLR